MRINSISTNVYRNTMTKPSFNGRWESQRMYNAAFFDTHETKTYIPDENETPYDIATAWEAETGLTPIDWVKKVNPFHQIDKRTTTFEKVPTMYKIKDHRFMPIEVLIASAKQKIANKYYYTNTQKLEDYADLAELYKLKHDDKQVEEIHEKMKNIAESESVTKCQNYIKELYRELK